MRKYIHLIAAGWDYLNSPSYFKYLLAVTFVGKKSYSIENLDALIDGVSVYKILITISALQSTVLYYTSYQIKICHHFLECFHLEAISCITRGVRSYHVLMALI